MVDMPSVGKRVKLVADGPAGSTSHEGVVLPEQHKTILQSN